MITNSLCVVEVPEFACAAIYTNGELYDVVGDICVEDIFNVIRERGPFDEYIHCEHITADGLDLIDLNNGFPKDLNRLECYFDLR